MAKYHTKVHGRAYDMIISPDGNSFHPEIIMYIFEELKEEYSNIEQFQVIQQEINRLDIILVRRKDFNSRMEDIISQRLRSVIHRNLTISFYYKDKIDREPSGKLRVIKSMLSMN